MASTAIHREFVDLVAAEMASGIDSAVECWMAQVERALTDMRLTTLGRLNAVRETLDDYKRLTGKTNLDCRRLGALASQRVQSGRDLHLPD